MRRILDLLLLLAVAASASACGLRPVYEGGSKGSVASLLGTIEVAPIEGHSGWLVRNRIVERLGPEGQTTPAYKLVVTLDDSLTSFGIRGDRAATRERRTLRARYQLVSLSTGLVVLDATAGSDAGIDIVSSEYATVAAEQSALENLAAKLADQVVARLATFAGARRDEQ